MWPLPALVLEDWGLFVVHYLWMGAVVGVFGLAVRGLIPFATPRQRYAVSLTVFSLLLVLGPGLAAAMLLPWGFRNLFPLFPSVSLPEWVLRILPVLPGIWMGVGLVLLAVLVLGLVGTCRLRQATMDAPQFVEELARDVQLRWKSSAPLRVRICQRIGEPILLGIWRPWILLPSAVLLQCRPEQLELILLHELAHIRRRDNLVLLLQRAAEAVFWFQPAVWMASRWVSRDREFCCDQFVLNESNKRRLYAETLVALAGMGRPKPSPFLVAFFGREHVVARIRYILHAEESAMSRSRSLAQVVLLGVVAALGLMALGSSGPQARGNPPVPAVQPAVPVQVAPAPALPVPVPVAVPQPAAPVLPSTYTEKPQVIVLPADPEDAPPEPLLATTPPRSEPVLSVPKRAWGPEQAEGPPDTPGAGDISTAWASQSQDGQKEWLHCKYAEAVMPTAVVVHETYNPGALEKVSVFDEDGQEHIAWTGTDPTPRTAERGTSIIPIKTKFKVQEVKIFFDSPAVPGWNEIDAVGLRSKDNTQWAEKVTASSTYAQDAEAVPVTVVPDNEFQQLQNEVNELKKEMQRMKQMEADLKELKELVKSLKETK